MPDKYLDQNGLVRVNENIDTKVADRVPSTRTVNSKPLTQDVTLTAEDVGGITTTQMNTAINVAIQDTWAAAY